MGRGNTAQYNRSVEIGEKPLMKPLRSGSVLAGCLLLCAATAMTFYAGDAGAKSPKKIQVRSHVDPAAQFSTYRTYGFVSMPGTNIDGKTTALTIYFMKAIREEMDSRGYQYTEESPDLWVNFNAARRATADEETTVTPAYGYSDYYGYRAGLYNMPFIGFGEQEETVTYAVGTANIDVVDARKKVLVWVSIAEGRLTDAMINSPDDSISKIVGDMFKKYPAKAAR
jgi:hypothetical protein